MTVSGGFLLLLTIVQILASQRTTIPPLRRFHLAKSKEPPRYSPMVFFAGSTFIKCALDINLHKFPAFRYFPSTKKCFLLKVTSTVEPNEKPYWTPSVMV